jgi:hypothetical protein
VKIDEIMVGIDQMQPTYFLLLVLCYKKGKTESLRQTKSNEIAHKTEYIYYLVFTKILPMRGVENCSTEALEDPESTVFSSLPN